MIHERAWHALMIGDRVRLADGRAGTIGAWVSMMQCGYERRVVLDDGTQTSIGRRSIFAVLAPAGPPYQVPCDIGLFGGRHE